MSEAKHTPGPWQYYYDESDHYVHKVRVRAGLVCQMPGWRINSELQTEQEANARLIAAAPEQHEALCSAPILSKYHGKRGFEVERFISDYEAWSERKRAAIAKAQGEQAC